VISALVLLNADRKRIPQTAEELLRIDGVAEVFSVTGEYDLVAILRLREYGQLATVVTQRMAELEGITRTHTMLAFRVYSKEDVEQGFSIGME
jgi:DNA-binding Lrp family transcriptional regulator